jgi:putative transposase
MAASEVLFAEPAPSGPLDVVGRYKMQRGDTPMSHPWKSSGQKRTIAWSCEQPKEVLAYLADVQDAIKYALQVGYRDAVREGKIHSPIALRREIKEWFCLRFEYARHHINPVCKAAVAILRSYGKAHPGNLRVPEVRKLSLRIDGELFRLVGSQLRITLRPYEYVWLPVSTSNRHFGEYTKGQASELLLTDEKVCLTFLTSRETSKPVGRRFLASDLNFRSLDMTTTGSSPVVRLEAVRTEPLDRIVQIQDDFSRRRERLQKHVRNPQKMKRKLKETRGRQRNRIMDALHKLSSKMVKDNPDTTFVFEDLTGVRGVGGGKGKRFRTRLNRWPYRMYQSFVDYKSPKKTLYPDPRGTSSECPVCGGILEHPTWGVSRCKTCGVDYDRNRLASLAILLRGARLCGRTPFAVSADASWQSLRDEYLHARGKPDAVGARGTEVASAPNGMPETDKD